MEIHRHKETSMNDDINKRINSELWKTIKSYWWVFLLQFLATGILIFTIVFGIQKAYQAVKRDFGNQPATTNEVKK